MDICKLCLTAIKLYLLASAAANDFDSIKNIFSGLYLFWSLRNKTLRPNKPKTCFYSQSALTNQVTLWSWKQRETYAMSSKLLNNISHMFNYISKAPQTQHIRNMLTGCISYVARRSNHLPTKTCNCMQKSNSITILNANDSKFTSTKI